MATNGTKDFETRLYINNEFVPAKSGKTLPVRNPVDDSIIAEVHIAGEEDVDLAVSAAKAAFKGEWSTFTGAQRAKCLHKLADLMEAKAAEFSRMETLCVGTPISLSTYGLTPRAVEGMRYYAGYADKLGGESFRDDGDGFYKIVQYEPLGVCAAVASWNATALYLANKLAPALAAGNTCIYKASEKSPLGVLVFAPLFAEAGFPPGVAQFITGGAETGALLSAHMGISKISFTGSAITGRKVQEAAARSNLKRVTLELGGKSPALVFEDADIENALTHCSQSFLMLTGQVCAASSRTLIHSSIAPSFISALKARFAAASASIGDDPSAATTLIGPLADKFQLERVLSFIEQGKTEAELITGGARKGTTGCFVEPTIFLNPKDDARIYREEVFGPVLSLRTFDTEDEAVQMANDTSFGLAASIYTSDIARALRVAKKVEAGMVTINSSAAVDINAAFGGMKGSGTGREGGKYGLMEYLEPKTVNINMNVPAKKA